jgi:aminoglycoside phosphotransferase (APT) family kinase protein
MPPLDPARLAAPVIGPVTQVDPINGFVGNQNFRLRTATGVYYLKAGADVVAEVSACALARSVDVPTPSVVAFDLAPPAHLITAELPGTALPRELGPGSRMVLAEVGRCIRRLHSLRDPSEDWRARLLEPIENLGRLDGILPAELSRRIRAAIPPFIDSVSDVRPVLLHGDLHPRHVFALSNKLTGIIDWGDALYGDPLFDLARLSMAGPAATTAFLSGYGPTDSSEQILSYYRAIWSLRALQAEHTAGGTWFHPHLDTLRHELLS